MCSQKRILQLKDSYIHISTGQEGAGGVELVVSVSHQAPYTHYPFFPPHVKGQVLSHLQF